MDKYLEALHVEIALLVTDWEQNRINDQQFAQQCAEAAQRFTDRRTMQSQVISYGDR